jgi:hypothetical protein
MVASPPFRLGKIVEAIENYLKYEAYPFTRMEPERPGIPYTPPLLHETAPVREVF